MDLRERTGKNYEQWAIRNGLNVRYEPSDEPDLTDDTLQLVDNPDIHIQMNGLGYADCVFSVVLIAGDAYYFHDCDTLKEAVKKAKELIKSA